jgi:nucleoside-diphosphate-sugar epimerase
MKAALGSLLRSPRSPAPFTVAWARLFTPLGPGDTSERLVPSLVEAMLRGDSFALTDCTQHVEVLDVSDAAAGLIALLDHGHAGQWNVASGEALVLRDIVESLADQTGDRSRLHFGARDRVSWQRDWYVGDSAKLRAETGWRPVYDLAATLDRVSEDGLRRCSEKGTPYTS